MAHVGEKFALTRAAASAALRAVASAAYSEALRRATAAWATKPSRSA